MNADTAVDQAVPAFGTDELDDRPAPDAPLEVDLPLVTDDDLPGALEAVLLVVDSPVTDGALAAAVGRGPERVREELVAMANRLSERRSGIELREIGGGWRFYTRDRFAAVVERFVLDGQQAR